MNFEDGSEEQLRVYANCPSCGVRSEISESTVNELLAKGRRMISPMFECSDSMGLDHFPTTAEYLLGEVNHGRAVEKALRDLVKDLRNKVDEFEQRYRY